MPGSPRLTLVAVSVASLVLACGGAPRQPPAERIVLIVVDTLRQDVLSSYGGWARTPVLDALAERGQRFPNAVAAFHQTTMSMGGMFTGRTPSLESGRDGGTIAFHGRSWCGMARFSRGRRKRCIPDEIDTLGEVVRDAGYWTIGVTSNALLFEPSTRARVYLSKALSISRRRSFSTRR